MKKTIILFFLILTATIPANAANTTFQPLQSPNQIQNSYGLNNVNSDNLNTPISNTNIIIPPAIIQIERSLFGRNFNTQSIPARLSRIENSLFTTSYPNANIVQRIDNIISNYNQLNKYPNISNATLSKLEQRVLRQTFAANTPVNRIERLEQQLFGAVQTGDINARLETIKIAAQNYNNTLSNNQGGWKGIASAIGSSLLGGNMTGFTPPINPYFDNYTAGYNNYANPYSQAYSNSYPNSYGLYRGVRTNHGYYDAYRDFNNGASVRILD